MEGVDLQLPYLVVSNISILEDSLAWDGIDRLLEDYVSIQNGDLAIILYTPECVESAIAVSAALEHRGIELLRTWIEPLNDEFLENRLDTLLTSLKLGQRTVLVVLERDTMSHAQLISTLLERHGIADSTVVRIISAGVDLFRGPMRADPTDLERRNATVLAWMENDAAEGFQITTRGGTDLQVRLSSEFRWISNRGISRDGRNIILPPGEVATHPKTIDGVLVADFAFNVNMITTLDARLDHDPITVVVQDSRAVEWRCRDRAKLEFVTNCLLTKHGRRIGELGFGTNPYVNDDPISHNSHVNERRCGVHLGFGQHNQSAGVLDYHCPVHLDLITRGAILRSGDSVLDLEDISPDPNIKHPDAPADEDVFAPDDCCGMN